MCVSSGARVNYFSRDAPQDVRRDKELVFAQRQPNFSPAAVHKKTSFDLISLSPALCSPRYGALSNFRRRRSSAT